MPAYNAARYIGAAIRSVCRQTIADWELLIVDDASSDATAAIVGLFRDVRIRLLSHSANQGVAKARNTGIRSATGAFLAFLDADDAWKPQKLARQLACFSQNPSVDICGTWTVAVGAALRRTNRYPLSHEEICANTVYDSPFATSSVMVRRAVLCGQADGPFDASYPPAEDYDLWQRLLVDRKGMNIPTPLVRYRVHPRQTTVSASGLQKQYQNSWRVRERALLLLGVRPTDEERVLHSAIGRGGHRYDRSFLASLERWLLRLVEANERTGAYDASAFRLVTADRWFDACRAAARLGMRVYRTYTSSPLQRPVGRGIRPHALLLLKCAMGKGA